MLNICESKKKKDNIIQQYLGFLWIYPLILNQLVVNGYLEENIILIDQYKPLKQG